MSANGSAPQLITLRDPRSAAAEAYRTLRTAFAQGLVDAPPEEAAAGEPLATPTVGGATAERR